MVRVLLCFLLFMPLMANTAEISVTISKERLGVNRPIRGTIAVAREEGQEIAVESFAIDDRPLTVTPIGESRSSTLSIINGKRKSQTRLVSTFAFEVEGQPEGLHVLPSISVEVDGELIETPLSTYQVQQARTSSLMEIESIVPKSTTVYVGQRIQLGYRVMFRDKVELTAQELPLLQIDGWQAVGQPATRSYSHGSSWVEELTQEMEAVQPGEYRVPAAVIEGFRYRQDWFGRRKYEKPRLRAESPPVTLVIQPLPDPKPEGFQGAVGDYSIQSEIRGANEVVVGDKIQLALTISGEGAWHTVRPPSLKNMPVIAREFRLSDLPPEVRREGNKAIFLYELRPRSPNTRAIPSIVFASFSVQKGDYITSQSEPIPLTVNSPLHANGKETAQPPRQQLESEERESSTRSIPIHPPWKVNAVATQYNFTYNNLLWTLFVLSLVLVCQRLAQETLRKRGRRTPGAAERLREASQLTTNPLAAIEKELTRLCMTPLNKNRENRVRELLEKIHALRYGGNEEENWLSVENEIQELINELD